MPVFNSGNKTFFGSGLFSELFLSHESQATLFFQNGTDGKSFGFNFKFNPGFCTWFTILLIQVICERSESRDNFLLILVFGCLLFPAAWIYWKFVFLMFKNRLRTFLQKCIFITVSLILFQGWFLLTGFLGSEVLENEIGLFIAAASYMVIMIVPFAGILMIVLTCILGILYLVKMQLKKTKQAGQSII